MLKKMCKSVLVRSLLDRSDIGGEVELGPSFRICIMHDVISHSVLEGPLADSRVVRKLFHLLRSRIG